ncbi:MAG: MATE family efflux transporter [bacterium]|nr:MATE family efflux transporter [bacterium]
MTQSDSIWRDLRDSIRGVEFDYTQEALGRAILLLSVPMMLEMSMESVFAVTDVFFVMKLGSTAAATVGMTEAMLTILYAVAVGLSMGTTAMVARRIGEKRPEAAGTAAVQAIALGIGLAIVVGLVGGFGANNLLSLMGGGPDLVTGGAVYTRIIFGGNITIFLLFLINAVFRGAGDASMAMRSLWLANLINIVLDPCLIFGLGPFPELGLAGAAVATTVGRGTGVLFQLWNLFGGRSRVVIRREQLVIVPQVALRLMRVSLFGILQFLISTASWVALVRIVSTFGEAALAGYTLAIRILIFAFLPAWGMSNAAATLVGQSLGAKQPERAEKAVWQSSFYNMAFLGTVGLIFILWAEFFVGLFTQEAEVTANAVACLRIVSYGYLVYALGMVLVQAFNGAGDTVTPTIINLFCFWLFEIPLAYTLARTLGYGPKGVYASIVCAEAMMAIVATLLFRRGTWKEREI